MVNGADVHVEPTRERSVMRSAAKASGHHPAMSSLANTRSTLGERRLVRPRHGKMIGGVAAGIARRYGKSPALIRILFVVSLILPGPQILAYIALWIIMPKEGRI